MTTLQDQLFTQNATLAPLSVARMHDEFFCEIPDDLYIPPEAFQILLEHFEGPLDFLLYLVHKNGLNLVELDIAPIATQYLAYMDSMKSLNIELTADYMVMAALLADLKSRLLLPKPTVVSIEKDPKQDLIDRLETYLRIKQAAERLGQMPVLDRDTFSANVSFSFKSSPLFFLQLLISLLISLSISISKRVVFFPLLVVM